MTTEKLTPEEQAAMEAAWVAGYGDEASESVSLSECIENRDPRAEEWREGYLAARAHYTPEIEFLRGEAVRLAMLLHFATHDANFTLENCTRRECVNRRAALADPTCVPPKAPLRKTEPTVEVIEAEPVLDLLERAYAIIRRGEIRLDADCSGRSPLTGEVEALLISRGRLGKTIGDH
jgi:hypothetical protein